MREATCVKHLGVALYGIGVEISWPPVAHLTYTQVLLSSLKVCFKAATFFFLVESPSVTFCQVQQCAF